MNIWIRKTFLFVCSTFLLNLVWELSQSSLGLYENYGGDFASVIGCTRAAVGDILIVGGVYVAMTLIYRRRTWMSSMRNSTWVVLVVISVLAAFVVEWWGLLTDRWLYSELMPLIPLLEIGVSPILQMAIIVPAVTLLVKRKKRYEKRNITSV